MTTIDWKALKPHVPLSPGSAALHCHVGPDLETAPEVRVPLPAISAAEALDWILSQIIPTADLEPAPWDEVQTAVKKASAL